MSKDKPREGLTEHKLSPWTGHTWHKNNSRDWFKDNPPTKEELFWDYECDILW